MRTDVGGGLRLRVLVVDDDDSNRLLTQLQLQRIAHHDVTLARDASEAVAACREHEFDVVLMDIRMPGMDGYDATRLIRSEPIARLPRIVALTADARGDVPQRCREAGMDACVLKPYDARELLQALNAPEQQPSV